MNIPDYKHQHLDLSKAISFEEMMNSVFEYFDIKMIYCRLHDEQVMNWPIDKLHDVTEILVPNGQPTYIKSIIQNALTIIQSSIDDYVKNHESYSEIKKTIETLKDQCNIRRKKNDIHKSLPYDVNEIQWILPTGTSQIRLFPPQLSIPDSLRQELLDHYSIRKEFYEEIIEILDKKLADHLDFPAFPKKPYKWDSDNPHMEIAELLFALIQTRIKIKDGEKGSFSKLAKEFYNLFGLDDSQYHQKLQQIRKRKNKKTWLQELPTALLGNNSESAK